MFFPFPDGLHPQGDVIIYQSNDTNITTNVLFKNETFWMPQKDIAQLFNVQPSAAIYKIFLMNTNLINQWYVQKLHIPLNMVL